MKPLPAWSWGVALLAAFLFSAPAHRVDAAGAKKIDSVEGISEYRLDNGLQVLLYPDKSKPTVTVNLTVFVGSRQEGYGETGMAHLLEHMLFKGTPRHPKIPKELQDHGARLQRHNLGRSHELLRDHAGQRREPEIRVGTRSRSPDSTATWIARTCCRK